MSTEATATAIAALAEPISPVYCEVYENTNTKEICVNFQLESTHFAMYAPIVDVVDNLVGMFIQERSQNLDLKEELKIANLRASTAELNIDNQALSFEMLEGCYDQKTTQLLIEQEKNHRLEEEYQEAMKKIQRLEKAKDKAGLKYKAKYFSLLEACKKNNCDSETDYPTEDDSISPLFSFELLPTSPNGTFILDSPSLSISPIIKKH